MEIDDIVRLNLLYDYYKDLLTDKEREYFESFYFDNLSLAEIASEKNVSRNAIYSSLQLSKDSLNEYESKLHLIEKSEKIKELLKKIKSDSNNDIITKIEEII